MQKNDLKNRDLFICSEKKKKKIRSQNKVEKGKTGQEMGKADKNPSKRIAGDDARGKRVTLKVSADKIRENLVQEWA